MPDSPPTPPTDADVADVADVREPAEQAAPDENITQEFLDVEDEISSESAPEKNSAQSATIPLPELGSQVLPSLQDGSLIAGRYQALSLLSSTPQSNIYEAVDQQGYLQCWACGSASSEEGDIYCVECGAQLTGRHYHLQEFPLSPEHPVDGSAPVPVPAAFLNNEVLGVAHVYNTLADAEAGRVYVVWEAVTGSRLNALSAGVANEALATQSGPLEAIDEERAISWMAQAAEVLVRLHAAGVVGCVMTGDNLVILPGDRLMLVDPSGCRDIDTESKQEPSEQASDVHNLGVELERWYMGVRALVEAPHEVEGLDGSPPPASASAALTNGQMVGGADEITGPLGGEKNVSLVLSRAREAGYTDAKEFLQALEELKDSGTPANFQFVSGRASDLGLVRQINEDSVLTIEVVVLGHEGSLPIGLYVIADGMGGHESGEVASSIAVRTIGGLVNSALIGPLLAGESVAYDPTTCGGLLRQAVLEANRRITALAGERKSDLGTTVVAALVVGNHVTLVNVGDSRAYSWHDGKLSPITQDHSLVAQLVAAGQLAPEEIYTHPRRNEIFRALGDARLTDEEIDIYHHRLQPGGGLLLCSDGLWDFVRDATIAGTLSSVGREGGDPQAICETLINQANTQGGEDNISAIFVLAMA